MPFDRDELLVRPAASMIVAASAFSDGTPSTDPGRWGLEALSGRLVELSARGATATLTAAAELVLEAQRSGEPMAWVRVGHTTVYPPDLADAGVDLSALIVIRVVDTVSAARAAERLLRSGAFGLVVLDFGSSDSVELPFAHQGRLVKLAQAHHAAVVCVTNKPTDAASIGSLVSLRAEATRTVSGAHYDVTIHVLKDKRRGPGWEVRVPKRGPAGFRTV